MWAKLGDGGSFRPGASWVDVNSSRVIGAVYTNNTGYLIQVAITPVAVAQMFCALYVDSLMVGLIQQTPAGGGGNGQLTAIIPNGSSYYETNFAGNGCGGGNYSWAEFR